MNAIVSEKGQVTIPKAVRDKLGITTGTVLDFQAVNGKVVAAKVMPDDEAALRKWVGSVKLKHAVSVNEYLGKIRDGHSR
jgi:AbrB family looped-hinge helix DNA binding protein